MRDSCLHSVLHLRRATSTIGSLFEHESMFILTLLLTTVLPRLALLVLIFTRNVYSRIIIRMAELDQTLPMQSIAVYSLGAHCHAPSR